MQRSLLIMALAFSMVGINVQSASFGIYDSKFTSTLSVLKSKMTQKKSLDERKTVLGELKKAVANAERPKDHDQHLNLNLLETFLDVLDENGFTPDSCEVKKAELILTFSPQNDDNPVFPEPAADAWYFLHQLCQAKN